MKKRYISMIAAGLMAAILAGCQETPKETIVKQKGADSIKSYESMEESVNGGLRETLGAPEHYTNKSEYQDGGLIIDTDADVILPDVNTMNTYTVSAKEVNQDMIDTVTQAFFPDAKFYSRYSYDEWTKKDYEEEIMMLKKYKAEGNLDPYDYGVDENGNPQFDIDEVIARDEEDMIEASEEITKEEVKPSFGLEYISGKGEEQTKEVDTDSFLGVAETSQGIYDYGIDNALSPDITFHITKKKDDMIEDPRQFSEWVEGEFLIGEGDAKMSEEDVKGLVDVSREEAEKTAKEAVEKLGWNMQVDVWDYALFCYGEGERTRDKVLDGGYLFHFTRMLDNVPITYTASYGGGLEDMDSTLTPWSYERCDVIVGDDGIQKVEIFNPYDIGEMQTENVKLMDFDSVIKIYEQMMEVSNADIAEFEANRTYHIKKIRLGYSRIYDPSADCDAGVLVPVWDFFGGFDATWEGDTTMDNGERSNQSFMTINAIDGTVINRDLGY